MNLFGVWRIHIGESFTDVPKALGQYRFVETIFHNGVTTGCGAGIFCPDGPATRGQMAIFLLIAKEGTSYTPPAATGNAFNDVPSSDPRAKWIEELYNRNIAAGCGNGNFCPDASVTRAQMAVFLVLVASGSTYNPPTATGMFTDVPVSSPFAKWVEEIARRGITAGCGPSLYCPNDPVTRGQMAVFLTTTFSLELNGL
jgi:hypothetical protein